MLPALMLWVGMAYTAGAVGDAGVQPVRPNLTQSLPLLHVDQAHRLGATGRGTTVLIIDNFTPNPLDPCHDFIHGAWVEGILRAVAPEAQILRLDVLLELPGTPESPCYVFSTHSLTQALASAVELHLRIGLDVINYSIGQGRFEASCPANSTEGFLIQELARAGVIFVTAAGNQGFVDALGFPSCMPETLSAGAVYDYTSTELELAGICADLPVVDKVTCYSNSASFLDALAPGSWITVSDELSTIGTSAAAPHVAGVVALLRQLDPRLSLHEIRELFRQTGKPVLDTRNGLTFPRVDALAAVEAVLQRPPVPTLAQLVEALDVDLDLRVGDDEILVAIEHWITGLPLPGTNFQIADDAILALIALWITAEPAALSADPDVW